MKNNQNGKEKKNKTGLARLLEIAGQKKLLLLLASVLVVLHSILLMAPYLLIYVILRDMLDGTANHANIQNLLCWSFVAIAFSLLLIFAAGVVSHLAAFNILYELRLAIIERLARLPMGYLAGRSSGALKKTLIDDVERIEGFIAHNLPDLVKAVTLPLLVLILLFLMDWRLALVSLLPLVTVGVLMRTQSYGKEGQERILRYHESLEAMNSGIVEFVRAMPMMKIFGQTASAFTRYSGAVQSFQIHLEDWTRLTTPLWSRIISFLNNALLPVLVVGLLFFFNHALSLSVFLFFLILGGGYLKPMFKLAAMGPQITMASHGVKRIDELLFQVPEQTSGAAPFPASHEVVFNQVSFAYQENAPVLQELSFRIAQGSLTALVGPSGAGKSTVGQLLARFYDPGVGTISIGGQNIQKINGEALMANIGFVFQDTMLFHQSMLENIRMGMARSREEVIEAAKKARCHECIEALPHGYDSCFGAAGVYLSGGEQQRVQLARVLLKDPPVLILDEATAFSDAENEHLIMAAMSELISDKTVLIIAHRLSTITKADQILVLDKGVLAGAGDHEALLGDCPLYRQMWEAHTQARDFTLLSKREEASC